MPESTRQRKAAVTATGGGDGVFAECLPDNTRQRINLCRVPPWTLGKEPAREGPHVRLFAECSVRHSTKNDSLPSVRDIALGKEPIPVPRSWFFAECYGLDTRQRTTLPSVTLSKVSSMHLFYLFFYIPSKQTKDITYTSHIYITDIITNINSQRKHKYPSQT
jgi:hypothetical protein